MTTENNHSKPAAQFNGRKKARRYAVQALYGWSMTQNSVREIEAFTFAQHQDQVFDKEYFSHLIAQITQTVTEIDTLMGPSLSRKLEELDGVELAVLRIAVYELKHRLEIPYRVVINEALNLTKTFGATDSYKFVNGVLDKLAKTLRSSEIMP